MSGQNDTDLSCNYLKGMANREGCLPREAG